MFECMSACFPPHKPPLVKRCCPLEHSLQAAFWRVFHHISVGTATGKQQRAEEWQRPSWVSETEESQNQLNTCVSLQFDAQEIRTVGMRPWLNSHCGLKHAFVLTVFMVCKSHEWRQRLLLVVILFILSGVLLSCDNKHSNVTVDGAAGDSSPFFLLIYTAVLQRNHVSLLFRIKCVWMGWGAAWCSIILCRKMALFIQISRRLLVSYFWLQLPSIYHFICFFKLS